MQSIIACWGGLGERTMDVPRYLQVLWESKWLLIVGAVVAAVVAFFAGFTITDGEVKSRATVEYSAETTLLLSNPTADMFQAVIPGQQLVEGQTQPEQVDLPSKAILFAYILSSSPVQSEVESQIGEFSDTESLRAVRRTTQPGGSEAFPGQYSLPLIGVIGLATSEERAEEISATAANVFIDDMITQQDEANIPDSDRVVVSVLDTPVATELEGSNPAIPVAVAFLGVFLLFVVAAFIIGGVRSSRLQNRDADDEATSNESHGDHPAAPADTNEAIDDAPEETIDDAPEETVDDADESVDSEVHSGSVKGRRARRPKRATTHAPTAEDPSLASEPAP
ncbi:hypothetical protein [Microbacterium sp. R86528]|uniref:hypothetical protein n=1 Tax=Microbacterium sp. R86528 TaxID=3093864 RepID=UPI0037C6ED42